MDPASASELRDFLARSNSRMDHQDEQRAASNRAIQALVTQVSELTTQLQRLPSEPEQRPTASNPPAPTIPDQAGSGHRTSPSTSSLLFWWAPAMPLLSCQMLTLYLSPTIVVSHRGIQDSVRHHTTLWTGSSLGNYRLGAETSLLRFVSVVFGGDQKGVWSGGFGQRGGFVFWRRYGREIGASLISPLNSALWRQSAGGIQKRSGICFFMDSLITSRTRSTHWNYPRHWMGLVSLAIRVDARLQQRGPRARRAFGGQ